jgi:hypothetical protein
MQSDVTVKGIVGAAQTHEHGTIEVQIIALAKNCASPEVISSNSVKSTNPTSFE